MTPEARKAFLAAAQVCDNVARIAIEHDSCVIQLYAHVLAEKLRDGVKRDEARSTVSLHEKRDGEADGASQ